MSKVFIVTGASRGLGLSIARALLRDSHTVFLVARSEGELRKLKSQHGDAVDYASADLADLKVSELPVIRLVLFILVVILLYCVHED